MRAGFGRDGLVEFKAAPICFGMSSTASVSSSLASLIQNLSQTVSPLASSPKVVGALEAASPADIARLSEAATQLQGVDALFGASDTSTSDTSATDSNSLLANLEQTLAGCSTPSTQSASGLDTTQIQTLFGSSINLLG